MPAGRLGNDRAKFRCYSRSFHTIWLNMPSQNLASSAVSWWRRIRRRSFSSVRGPERDLSDPLASRACEQERGDAVDVAGGSGLALLRDLNAPG